MSPSLFIKRLIEILTFEHLIKDIKRFGQSTSFNWKRYHSPLNFNTLDVVVKRKVGTTSTRRKDNGNKTNKQPGTLVNENNPKENDNDLQPYLILGVGKIHKHRIHFDSFTPRSRRRGRNWSGSRKRRCVCTVLGSTDK